jgi:predicted RNase H-like nuclease
MYFVGLDLAWSPKNGSGLTILKGNKEKAELIFSDVLNSDDDITNKIDSIIKKENAFIAIDAPLIVPNSSGRRIAEKLVGELFRKYNAGAHPANRPRLSQWSGTIRGEDVVSKLEKINFKHNPYIKKFEETRKSFEVYPHPSMVVLFNLNSILKYKSKPKRDYNFRYLEFEKYQNHLKELEFKTPKLILPKEIINKNVKELKAQKLKNYEDLLDSIFCAYIAYYCWYIPEKCKVLGNMSEGYILTPVFDK